MANLYIHDSGSGLDLHSSCYLPLPLIMSIQDSNAEYMIDQMIGWEADFVEEETEGIYFPMLGTTEGFEVSAEWLGYQQKVKQGQAKFISRRATNFPTTGQDTRPFVQATIPIGIAYTINLFQQAASQKFGVSLDSNGMADCAEYIDLGLDEGWHYGGVSEEDHTSFNGMFMLFNGGGDNELAAGTTLPKVITEGGDVGDTWDLMTGNEIVNDIENGIATVMKRSRNKKKVSKIAWGLRVEEIILKKDFVNDTGGVERLKSYLKRAYPEIEFVVDTFFDDIQLINPHETFAGQSAVMYYSDDKKNFKFRANRREVIHPYEAPKGFQLVKVNCFGICGGIQAFNNYFGAYQIVLPAES